MFTKKHQISPSFPTKNWGSWTSLHPRKPHLLGLGASSAAGCWRSGRSQQLRCCWRRARKAWRGRSANPWRGNPGGETPSFFRVSQVQNANMLTQNDAPEVVKRSIVYPTYPTSSMSFILQVVNILVYLHAFIYAFMGHDGISHAVHLRSVCELGIPPEIWPFFSKPCREFAMEWMEHRKRWLLQ